MARRFSLSRHHAVVYSFLVASDAGRMPRFPRGDGSGVPSAGMTLYQTDFAFLPV
jgi:hypothetical protein